uniref:Uncharacterized protein n=1 Tax=Arundo donax TaxID=35708 RepID=A0A0A8ZAX3_ARUDO
MLEASKILVHCNVV